MQLDELTIGMKLEAQNILGIWIPSVITDIRTYNDGRPPLVEVRSKEGGTGLRTLDELRLN